MGVVEDDCEMVVLGRTMVEMVEEMMLRGDAIGLADFVRDDEVVDNNGEAESEGVLATTDVETKREEPNDSPHIP
jgi:hypothetical protein